MTTISDEGTFILSDAAVFLMRGNNILIGALMMEHNRCQNTIENWMIAKDKRLVTPSSIRVIEKYTGLAPEKIVTAASKRRRPGQYN